MILETQVRALDTAIQSLDQQITLSNQPRVNKAFKDAWRQYTARWQVQRDSWLGAGDITRKFGFSEDVFNQFKDGYRKWLADYQQRIPSSALRPPAAPAQQPGVISSVFNSLFAGSGTALLVTALIIGGVIYILHEKKTERKR